jgi:hypothetical protein
LVFFAAIEDDHDQAIGFQLRRSGGGEVCIHDGLASVSTAEGGLRNSATEVLRCSWSLGSAEGYDFQ